ncbi:MAG: hypothetical protein DI535_19475 [Citrobacter freundii]|nr:MAG: hypothetical protein DI535_19475 [Citrobacter freundii]
MKLVQKIAVGYLRNKFRVMSSISPARTARQAFKLFSTPGKRTTGPLPPAFSEAEKLHFKFEQYQITGFRWNKGKGPRALVIHGFKSSMINFDPYIKGLRDKGYEVLAFDAPAHGLSSGKRLNVLEYSNFIRYINDQFGPVDFFMAHSLGALALCMALAEIGVTEKNRVVLIAPATETVTAVNQFFHFVRLKRPEVREEFDKLIIHIGGKPAAWFSVGRTLEHLHCPILWLHDEDDQITPLADALKIKNRDLPNIKFVITNGLGHNRIYREAAIREQVLNFL